MNRDQADELRLLVRTNARHSPSSEAPVQLIAVTGGQRGVGTTTIALNLSVAFALEGQRTILVDADLDRGAVAGLCGLSERGSILDVLSSRRSIHEVLARGPAGIQVLPGVWAPHEANDCSATSQGRLISQLKRLGAHADVVVVDTGSGRSSFVRRFWQAADMPLVVTTPDPVAIMDCYATIKVLLAGDASIGIQIAVNRTTAAQQAADVQTRIAAACRRFLGVRATAAGQLPDERLVHEAARLCTPFVLSSPRSEAARAMEQLSETLWLKCRSQAADPSILAA
jgi:flagellar biosynthesis protein FlhG